MSDYETLPWVADFLNRRTAVIKEMREVLRRQAGAGSGTIKFEQLRDWITRLEVPSEFLARNAAEERRSVPKALAPDGSEC